jgi:predicted DNA-binding transcriptional regulator AlpA
MTAPADVGAGPRLAYSETDLDELGVLSRATRWRMRRRGEFPEPVTAGGRKLYRAADVHAWLRDPEVWASARRAVSAGGRSRGPR